MDTAGARYVAVAIFVALMCAHSVHAHSTLTEVIPASESVLAESPEVIELVFEHAAHLTSVMVVEEDGSSGRKLEFNPRGSAKLFEIRNPELAVGRNEIRWKALSSDGHVIGGSLFYVIGSGALQTR